MRIYVCLFVTLGLVLLTPGLAAAEPPPEPPARVQTPAALRATQGHRTPANPAAARPIRHWIFAPGRYTNDPVTGKRVEQFKKIAPVERVPNDLYYAPSGDHPYGPDYDYNQLYRMPGIAPIPYNLPGIGLAPMLPLGPRLPW
jgi:hypothetical protein